MSSPNPKGHPESLRVTPLVEGEKSRPVRIRAEAWVFEELAELSAIQVGELVANALRDKKSKMSHGQALATTLTSSQEPTVAGQQEQPLTGSKLTREQSQICAALRMKGAVADYDFYEQAWLAGFAGVRVNGDALEELARLGVLTVTGEGKAAVYQLAPQVPSVKRTSKRVTRSR